MSKEQVSFSKLMMLAIVAMISAHSLPAQFVNFTKWEDSGLSSDAGAPAGLTAEDYDGDGRIDLLVLNGTTGANFSNILYRNTPDGFEDVTATALPSHFGKYNAGAFADYNGDGILDLYLARWNVSSSSNLSNQLFAGQGDGTFLSAEAGDAVTDPASNPGCSWADYDSDGWVDIFTASMNTSFGAGPNNLYRNLGNGTFQKNTTSILVTGIPQFTFSGNWADVDGDRDLDLFVANAFGPDRLYYNNGSGNFTPNTDNVLFNTSNFSYRATFADYDNDGDLDFLITGEKKNRLYINDGTGHFEWINGPWELDIDTFTAAWGDYDNDGDLDLFITSIDDNNSLMFRNEDGELELEFEAITPTLDGFASVADFNNDGFLDLAIANGGFPNTTLHTSLFLNEGNENLWAQFQLKGSMKNTSAIGAKVRIKAIIDGQESWQMRQVASSSHEDNTYRLHFGLGDAMVIDSMIIEWPDGGEEIYTQLASRQICTIEQGGQTDCLLTGLGQKEVLPGTLTLVPNPARNLTRLHLETEAAYEKYTITLYNPKGQVSWSAQERAGGTLLEVEVPLRGLPAGLYLVEVQAGARRIARSLVITP